MAIRAFISDWLFTNWETKVSSGSLSRQARCQRLAEKSTTARSWVLVSTAISPSWDSPDGAPCVTL